MFGFGGDPEVIERARPEPAHPFVEFSEALGAGPIQMLAPGSSGRDEAGVAQHSEMLADRGSADVEVRGYGAGRLLLGPYDLEDPAAGGIGQRVGGAVKFECWHPTSV